MSPSIFFTGFIMLWALGLIVDVILDRLNLHHAYSTPLPHCFQGHFDTSRLDKALRYLTVRTHFGWAQGAVSAVWFLLLIWGGLLVHWQTWVNTLALSPAFQGVVFFVGLSVAQTLLALPGQYISQFHIEAAFGFNNSTRGLFLTDLIKSTLISALIGLPLLYIMLRFLYWADASWWIWAWAFMTVIQLVMMIAYPMWIAPLFNKFTPLEPGPLRDRLFALAERCQFSTKDILIMDGSRRSAHSNAYFTGLGSFRRIVFYDTLIEQLSDEELEAVLAHEIGHYKHGHIIKHVAVSTLMSGLSFFALAQAIQWPLLYEAFGFSTVEPYVGMMLFFLSLSTIGTFVGPWFNITSRRHEYQADAYAVAHSSDPSAIAGALVNLSKENLSNPVPHPWYSFVHYSHPTTAERIAAIES